MHTPTVPHSQQCLGASRRVSGHAQAGRWRLACGEAMGLRPRRAGVLSIHCGSVWLTVSGPGACGTDRFLEAGGTCALRPGQHAVMEPWTRRGRGPEAVAFDWVEVPEHAHLSWPSRASAVRSAGIALVGSLGDVLRAHAALAVACAALCRALVTCAAGRPVQGRAAPGH